MLMAPCYCYPIAHAASQDLCAPNRHGDPTTSTAVPYIPKGFRISIHTSGYIYIFVLFRVRVLTVLIVIPGASRGIVKVLLLARVSGPRTLFRSSSWKSIAALVVGNKCGVVWNRGIGIGIGIGYEILLSARHETRDYIEAGHAPS